MSKFSFFIVLLQISSLVHAQALQLGGPKHKPDFNVLLPDNPLAMLVGGLVCPGLLSADKAEKTTLGFNLNLAKSVKFEEAGLSVELSKERTFSNQTPIQINDVVWSLERCKSAGRFSQVTGFFKGSIDKSQNSVHLAVSSGAERQAIIDDLIACPIVEHKSAQIFAENLGVGTNVICAGDYAISDFRAGDFYKLVRQSSVANEPSAFEVKAIDGDEEGLRLLRNGKLTLFFTESILVHERAMDDPTLKVGKCADFAFVARHDFEFVCPGGSSRLG